MTIRIHISHPKFVLFLLILITLISIIGGDIADFYENYREMIRERSAL